MVHEPRDQARILQVLFMKGSQGFLAILLEHLQTVTEGDHLSPRIQGQFLREEGPCQIQLEFDHCRPQRVQIIEVLTLVV